MSSCRFAWIRPAQRLSVLLLTLGLASPALAAYPDREVGALGGTRYDSGTLSNFVKWAGVVERTWAREAAAEAECADRLRRGCRLTEWQSFLRRLRHVSPETQIDRVNRFVNGTNYSPDLANWGAIDYWAAPGEFFARGGDCEDYAIAKYYSLRTLGVPVENMRIVVVRETQRRIDHAVLVVRHAGRDLVLDNLNDRVVSWAEAHSFRPIYSLNERSYWLHGRSSQG